MKHDKNSTGHTAQAPLKKKSEQKKPYMASRRELHTETEKAETITIEERLNSLHEKRSDEPQHHMGSQKKV